MIHTYNPHNVSVFLTQTNTQPLWLDMAFMCFEHKPQTNITLGLNFTFESVVTNLFQLYALDRRKLKTLKFTVGFVFLKCSPPTTHLTYVEYTYLEWN